jgi:hypothetical protein
MASTLLAKRSKVHPPPTTMPSSTAALVAFKASSTRSFFSLSSVSVSVWAPIWMMATPPESLAMRSFSFSFSK